MLRKGQLLYEVDDAPYRYALQNARAQQAQLEGQIANETRHIESPTNAALAAAAASRSAAANLIAADAAIEQMCADVADSVATVKQAKAEFEYANDNLHRLEPLLPKQFVTTDQVEQARSLARAREQAVHQASAHLSFSRPV
jgi:multidrug efflux system membrane fusion protein